MELKKTLVVGASENPARYSNKAIHKLRYYGQPVVALGLKSGKVEDVEIETGQPTFAGIDTITLYLSAKNQEPLQEYLLNLKPKRIIFNPGAENEDLKNKAIEKGIEVEEACTLVMLTIGAF